MSEIIPESFEVLLHYLQTLVEAAGEAQVDEVSSRTYMDMIEELSQNKIRLFGVLSIIASALYHIGQSSGFELHIGSENPEDYEVLLVSWVDAVKKLDAERIADLSSGLSECSSDMIEGFMFLLMSFYLTLVEDS